MEKLPLEIRMEQVLNGIITDTILSLEDPVFTGYGCKGITQASHQWDNAFCQRPSAKPDPGLYQKSDGTWKSFGRTKSLSSGTIKHGKMEEREMPNLKTKQKPRRSRRGFYYGNDLHWMYDLFDLPTQEEITRSAVRHLNR